MQLPGRWATRGAALAGGLGCLLLATPASADCVDGRPHGIGHRGTGNSTPQNPYPENTLPSLVAAGEQGASMVEIDVQLSADGVPVLMHDLRVEATTDGVGCVSELTLAELEQLDAGVGTPMEGMGVQIPTLEQVLQGTELDLDVELKLGGAGCPAVTDPVFVSAVLDVLDGDPVERRHLLSSFDFPLLQEVRAQDPGVGIGQLTVTPASAMAAADADFDALVLVEGSVDEATVPAVRELDLELIAWTVDDPARLAELVALDIDGIITNEPDVLQEVRQAACPTADDSGGTTGEPTGDSGSGDTSTTGERPAGTDSSPPPGQGDDDQDAGCGCGSPGHHGAGSGVLALLMALLRRPRRPRRATRAPRAPRDPRSR